MTENKMLGKVEPPKTSYVIRCKTKSDANMLYNLIFTCLGEDYELTTPSSQDRNVVRASLKPKDKSAQDRAIKELNMAMNFYEESSGGFNITRRILKGLIHTLDRIIGMEETNKVRRERGWKQFTTETWNECH